MSVQSRGIPTGMPQHRPGRPRRSAAAADNGLLGAFADLELEAEGLHLDQRSAEVEDLAVAGYAAVTLGARLLGSLGAAVRLRLEGGLAVEGALVRAGEDWAVVEGRFTWLVPAAAITRAEGLGARAVADEARTVLARLSLASALRRLAGERTPCLVHLRDGGRVEGPLTRVGADFLELAGPRGVLVPLAALAAVQEVR